MFSSTGVERMPWGWGGGGGWGGEETDLLDLAYGNTIAYHQCIYMYRLDAPVPGKRRRRRRRKNTRWKAHVKHNREVWRSVKGGGRTGQDRVGRMILNAIPVTPDDEKSRRIRRRRRFVCIGKKKQFQKSEFTMEVGGWVQISLGIFFFWWKIIPK